ncbi:fructosamine kinase family protein [Saxibacter everestensis]|uniref:Fructosamine kinase family protein n=1 Tax=Saxibacter everestensis TaxID=2909229 RepID=A0ABY8QW02_9MICO|nr:fructosamine kinase family protein [Brevibacteriaceae bacterium ZFBP1038]
MPASEIYRKRYPPGSERVLDWEVAALRWLAAAEGGAAVVPVLTVGDGELCLERLHSVAPSAQAAAAFGERLAATHDAGAPGFGAAPEGWHGDGYFGPLGDALPMPLVDGSAASATDQAGSGAGQAASATDQAGSVAGQPGWGRFYADYRLQPLIDTAAERGSLDADEARHFEPVLRRLRDGEFDDGDRPARLHGDLWAGNLLWTDAGAVLIDPAAHGGHRESDLAMLHLFGAPFLDRITASYSLVFPLKPGWRERIALHQLFPLLAHVILFGGGYLAQTLDAARRYR